MRGVLAGSFDVLHPGYIYMFEEAKKYCSHLTVLLHSDPSIERPKKIKPILTVQERMAILGAIRYVDNIIVYETESELISILQDSLFDIRFLGKDYLYSDYTGKHLNILIHFIDREHGWSTTKFKQLIVSQYLDHI